MSVIYKVAILLNYPFKDTGYRDEKDRWVSRYEDAFKQIIQYNYDLLNLEYTIPKDAHNPGWGNDAYHEWSCAKDFLEWLLSQELDPYKWNFISYSREGKIYYKEEEYTEMLKSFWLDYFRFGRNRYDNVIMFYQSNHMRGMKIVEIRPVEEDVTLIYRVRRKIIDVEFIEHNTDESREPISFNLGV